MYLLNSFSLQMVDVPCSVMFEEVQKLPEGLVSAVGHADTAKVLGVECNRMNVHLSKGDVAYVAQLQGGRLPEGSTTLPKGFSFKFIKATIVAPKKIEDALYEAYAEGQWAGDNGHAAQVVNEIKEKYSL